MAFSYSPSGFETGLARRCVSCLTMDRPWPRPKDFSTIHQFHPPRQFPGSLAMEGDTAQAIAGRTGLPLPGWKGRAVRTLIALARVAAVHACNFGAVRDSARPIKCLKRENGRCDGGCRADGLKSDSSGAQMPPRDGREMTRRMGSGKQGWPVSGIMSTVPMTPTGSESSQALAVFQGGDQRTVFRGVDWHTYNQLSRRPARTEASA